MNIFASFDSPEKSAAYLDDARCIKQALECTQLCSTAVLAHGGISPYKLAHPRHPASIWTAANLKNFCWVAEHGLYLCKEYYKRFNKIHKCSSILLYLIQEVQHSRRIPDTDNPIVFKFIGTPQFDKETNLPVKDVHESYREYLKGKWKAQKRAPKWYSKENPYQLDDFK